MRTTTGTLLVFFLAATIGCSEDPLAPTLTRVEPIKGVLGKATSIEVIGSNFFVATRANYDDQTRTRVDARFQLWLGDVALENVAHLSASALSALVPASLAAGEHELRLVDPYGRTASLARAFTVVGPTSDGASDSAPDGADAAPDGPVDAAADSGIDQTTPDTARDTADLQTPDAAVDSLAQDSTVDSLAQDSTADSLAQDLTADSLRPDSSADSLAPDLTVDSAPDSAPPDASAPDAPSCSPLCDNGCAGGVCHVTCGNGNCSCPNVSVPCVLDCSANGGDCNGTLDCGNAPACSIICEQSHCKGQIKCGSGPCGVSCKNSSCDSPIICGSGDCKINCESSACKKQITCGSGFCSVTCDSSACKQLIDCNGACACEVTCTGSECKNVSCLSGCAGPGQPNVCIASTPACNSCP